MTETSEKNIVVLYHGDCPDGFSAAWAAWKKLGDTAEYTPLYHGKPLPYFSDKDVFLLDIIPSVDAVNKIISCNRSVIPIDHHKSNNSKLDLFEKSYFDIDKSGAVLTWEYFHPNKNIPLLLRYIQDIDIWKFELPSSREINAYIPTFDYSFPEWEHIATMLDDSEQIKGFIEKGAVIVKYENFMINKLLNDNAQSVNFEGYETLAINSPVWSSWIGYELVKRKPPISITWSQLADQITVSLRSDGNVDVSLIAKKYGGGGHKAAAGFELPIKLPLPWKKHNHE